jgi:hypothetical protein
VSTVAVETESTATVVESTQHSFTDVESVFATSSAEELPPFFHIFYYLTNK